MYDFKVGKKYRLTDKAPQTSVLKPFIVLCTDGGGLRASEDIFYRASDEVAVKAGHWLWGSHASKPAVELAHICYDITPIHTMLENE